MNKYIFLTNEGQTMAPNEEQEIDNAQLLGIALGNDEKEAFENLKMEIAYLKKLGFNEVFCYKLSNDFDKNMMYFYL